MGLETRFPYRRGEPFLLCQGTSKPTSVKTVFYGAGLSVNGDQPTELPDKDLPSVAVWRVRAAFPEFENHGNPFLRLGVATS